MPTNYELLAQMLRNAPSREQQAGFGDTEWQADIARRRGPLGYQLELDPKKAKFFPTKVQLEVLGRAADPSNRNTNEFTYQTDEAGNRARGSLAPGEYGVFGREGASPMVWGHEAMHNQYGTGENWQRVHDAYSARNKEELDEVVNLYAQYKRIPKQEAQDQLVDAVSRNAFRLAESEQRKGATVSPDAPLGFWEEVLTPGFAEDDLRYRRQRNRQSYIMRELRGK